MALPHPATRVHLLTLTALCPALVSGEGDTGAAQKGNSYTLKFIVTEDSLSSNAPHIETLHAHGLHDILGVTEGDHAHLFTQVQAAEHAGRVTYYARHDRAAGVVHRFRLVNDVPLKASNADVRVNFIA